MVRKMNWEKPIIDSFRQLEEKIRDIERRLDNLEEVTQRVDPWEVGNE